MFVHQWAHFRYGVFDEYGCHDDNQYPLTYCHSGKVKLNACSERIAFAARTATGGQCSVDSACRLSEDCVVSLQHPRSGHPTESSIMFMPHVGNVSHFCDDAGGALQHYPFAPNKQNRLCQQRSTWEVISGNADFQKLPKPDMSKRIEISFVETQETNIVQRVVLVLDVSSSMQHLKTSDETTEGAVIVLLSDGEGNKGPDIESVMPWLLEAKVIVSTLAVGGTAAEKLEKLASATRGKAYAFQDKQGNIALDMEAAFVEVTAPSLQQASREQTNLQGNIK
ncbi:calcium-activated chloride channel regulator 1-like [Dermacentor variabilis]|uniref:calcium-activated chloride channel regulator 1-like n=1 Tax=Dermacentor variabilis TaxID=34621 RepID=UPI003F5BF003